MFYLFYVFIMETRPTTTPSFNKKMTTKHKNYWTFYDLNISMFSFGPFVIKLGNCLPTNFDFTWIAPKRLISILNLSLRHFCGSNLQNVFNGRVGFLVLSESRNENAIAQSGHSHIFRLTQQKKVVFRTKHSPYKC